MNMIAILVNDLNGLLSREICRQAAPEKAKAAIVWAKKTGAKTRFLAGEPDVNGMKNGVLVVIIFFTMV